MENFEKSGDVLTLTAPYTVASGAGALVGKIFGVAVADVASGADGEFRTKGVFTLAKLNTSVWVKGQKVFWDNTNKRCDGDPAVGPCIGVAHEAAANPTTTAQVKLNGDAVVLESAAVAPAHTALTTAGAETYTVAQLLTGKILRDCNGAGRTDVLPTAALLVAGIPGAQIGDEIRCLVINNSDAAETITIDAGVGGTITQIAGTRIIPQNTAKEVVIRLTNVTAASEAYAAYVG